LGGGTLWVIEDATFHLVGRAVEEDHVPSVRVGTKPIHEVYMVADRQLVHHSSLTRWTKGDLLQSLGVLKYLLADGLVRVLGRTALSQTSLKSLAAIGVVLVRAPEGSTPVTAVRTRACAYCNCDTG
jgi:hypothetical protein